MTFKKGDKVRILKTLNGHTFATGEIVEIVHSLPAEAPDNYLGYVCKNERGEQSAVGADEIELYKARVPKVGDKVKIIADVCSHGFEIGATVEIIENTTPDPDFYATDGTRKRWLEPTREDFEFID